MWGRTSYVVTIFDPEAGKVYKHHHDTRREADHEVLEAKRWAFVAWVTPTQRGSMLDEAKDEAAT